MDAHEVLVAGRNRIANVGWAHLASNGGWWFEADGASCANNSLDCEAEGWLDAVEVLLEVVGASHLGALFAWNDTPGRTKGEVLAAFDKAIAATAPEPDFASLTSVDNLPEYLQKEAV